MSWELSKLSTLCSINSGGTPSRSNSSFFNGSIPWAKISDIESAKGGVLYSTEECISVEGLKSINNRIFPKGTLLLAIYGSVGKVAFAGLEMSTNQAILGIKIKDVEKLDYSYLKYWFQIIKDQLLNRAVGGTLQNISLGIVKDLEIPLPPLSVQKRIAEILDAADALRRKDQELLKKYDELAQAIFIDMFGELEDKRYQKRKLIEIALISNGVTKNGKKITESMIETPYLRVANVQDGFFALDEIKTIKVSVSDFNKYQLEKLDLLVTEGGDPDKLGRGSIWMNEIPGSIFQNHLFRIRVKSEEITPFYLSKLLSSGYGKKYFLKAAKQTTGIASINSTQLKAFPVRIPSMKDQISFERRISEISNLQNTSTLKYSERLFNSLIQKAFKGELVY